MKHDVNEAPVNLENDEVVTIETLQYGAYDAAGVTPGHSCSCNSNCNSASSSDDPIG
jgi:hypothetical protein